jgi:release factor glutamine methyltransferase
MDLHALLQQGTAYLAGGSPTPLLDAEVLLAYVCDKPRSFLYAQPEHQLSSLERKAYAFLLDRRSQGMPVAYLVGAKEFWSLNLQVNEKVLIPRPETECLVTAALTKFSQDEVIRVADLGTGSGAIAIALASERALWGIAATDNSKAALRLARDNAKRLHLENIQFYLGDWFDALPPGRFQMICANPPYIAASDPHLVAPEMRYEPRSALIAPDNGYASLTTIITQAKAHLTPGGWLLVEHGATQAEAVRARLAEENYVAIDTLEDYAGLARISQGRVPFRRQKTKKKRVTLTTPPTTKVW